MERGEFISKLGLGLVMACAGCGLASCGSKGSDPSPSAGGMIQNPPPTGTGNLFSLDLSNQLTNIGESAVQQGVIVVRIASGNAAASFTAVQVACTHQGNPIGFNQGQGIFICPLHGSEFSKTGQVLMGPAETPLHRYTVAVDSGGMLTVSA